VPLQVLVAVAVLQARARLVLLVLEGVVVGWCLGLSRKTGAGLA